MIPDDNKPAMVETPSTDADTDGEQATPEKADWRDAQDNPWVPDEEAPPPVIGS